MSWLYCRINEILAKPALDSHDVLFLANALKTHHRRLSLEADIRIKMKLGDAMMRKA